MAAQQDLSTPRLKQLVGPIGFGAMPLSTEGRPSQAAAIEVLHYVFDAGIKLIDTADCYCTSSSEMHHNERLIAEAIRTYSGDSSAIVVATKGGIVRPGGEWVPDGDPKRLAQTIRESAEILGAPIALWQHHAPDEQYPVEDSLAPAVKAVEEGLIKSVGVSNYSLSQLATAIEMLDIVSVQNQYNLWCRLPEQDGVLEYCSENQIAFIPWSPLGGRSRVEQLKEMSLLKQIAERHLVSVAQVVLAWLRQKSPVVIPIPGARTIEHAGDLFASTSLELSDDERHQLDLIQL